MLSKKLGTSCTSNLTVLSVTMEGRHLLIYLFNFYYVLLATFLRQYFFFLMGNHSESTNRTICPIVLKNKSFNYFLRFMKSRRKFILLLFSQKIIHKVFKARKCKIMF